MYPNALLLIGALFAAPAAAGPEPVTIVRSMTEIVEIRPELVSSDADRRDRVLFGQSRASVVGQIEGDEIIWASTDANRARYGAGADAPSHILVRAFDAVFAIDPFAPLPQGGGLTEWKPAVGVEASRQLFNRRATLETDRAFFGHRRVERTEELFTMLERQRQSWLRANGYTGVRHYRRSGIEKIADKPCDCADACDERQSNARPASTKPEPAGWFRKPAELPATKSREQVRRDGWVGSPSRQAQHDSRSIDPAGVARALLDGSQTRISLPPATRADVARRVAQHQADQSEQQRAASHNTGEEAG